jgi:hypothetical protein
VQEQEQEQVQEQEQEQVQVQEQVAWVQMLQVYHRGLHHRMRPAWLSPEGKASGSIGGCCACSSNFSLGRLLRNRLADP